MENDVLSGNLLGGPDASTSTVPLVSSCLKAFKLLSSALDDVDILDQFPLRKAIEECNGRFRVWSGNIGAHQTGKGSLDYRLRDASYIKTRVLRLLEDLTELLSDATSIVTGARQALEDVVSDSDSSETESEFGDGSPQGQRPSEMHQILTEVSEVVNCLYRLSMSVRNPTGTRRYIKSAHIDTSFYEPWDLKYVEQKFPSAKVYLVERLGKAISRRRQYLKYRETHAAKIAQRLDGEGTATARSETTASALLDQSSRLEDSRSVVSESSYATSTGSVQKPRMPSMPKEARAGLPFECPYCRTIEVVKDTHTWMKHVRKDLQPYMCTLEDCATPHEMYEGRRQWFNHELQKHRRSWRCNGHCNQMFTSEDALANHVRKHLPGQYSDAQIPVLVEMWASQIDSHAEASCPLCCDRVAGTIQLQKHLGRHLEEIALFALPSNDAESEEDNHSQGSSLIGGEADTPLIRHNEVDIFCDICATGHLTRYYHCSTCDYGNFDVCQQCFDSGHWCQNREHSMAEHSADRGLDWGKIHHWREPSHKPEGLRPPSEIMKPMNDVEGSKVVAEQSNSESDQARSGMEQLGQPEPLFDTNLLQGGPKPVGSVSESVASTSKAEASANRPSDGLQHARWTKLDRKLVIPEALKAGNEEFEATGNHLLVWRVLTRDEIEAYAIKTQEIRDSRVEDAARTGPLLEEPLLCHHVGCDRASSKLSFAWPWHLEAHLRLVHNEDIKLDRVSTSDEGRLTSVDLPVEVSDHSFGRSAHESLQIQYGGEPAQSEIRHAGYADNGMVEKPVTGRAELDGREAAAKKVDEETLAEVAAEKTYAEDLTATASEAAAKATIAAGGQVDEKVNREAEAMAAKLKAKHVADVAASTAAAKAQANVEAAAEGVEQPPPPKEEITVWPGSSFRRREIEYKRLDIGPTKRSPNTDEWADRGEFEWETIDNIYVHRQGTRPRLSEQQTKTLEVQFELNSKPSTETKKSLAYVLELTLDKVNNWFQNRRAKAKMSAWPTQEKLDSRQHLPTPEEADFEAYKSFAQSVAAIPSAGTVNTAVDLQKRIAGDKSLDAADEEDKYAAFRSPFLNDRSEGGSLRHSSRQPAPVIINSYSGIAVDHEDHPSLQPQKPHGATTINEMTREHPRSPGRVQTPSPSYRSEYETQSRLKRLELLEKQDEDEKRKRGIQGELLLKKASGGSGAQHARAAVQKTAIGGYNAKQVEEAAKQKAEEEVEEEYKDRMWHTLHNNGYTDAEIENILKKGSQKNDMKHSPAHSPAHHVHESSNTVLTLARPTYIKVNKKHLDPYTLDVYELPWEWDEVGFFLAH
ncbi:hypothetical protein MMC30_004903 [Trapelia coarctata]|nr:hypothetical protein [Trapelia coarctata]